MTKTAMIERIQKAEAKAWREKELDAFYRCPRVSVEFMFKWLEQDDRHYHHVCEWYALSMLLDELGIETNHDEYTHELSSRLFRECREAENN